MYSLLIENIFSDHDQVEIFYTRRKELQIDNSEHFCVLCLDNHWIYVDSINTIRIKITTLHLECTANGNLKF